MDNFKNIHFIGIGGIGISALAYLSLAEGKKVTGSDSISSTLIDNLIEGGAHIVIGHNADNVTDDTELVVYTEAIDQGTNPELLRAKELRIPVLSYFEALGQVSRTKKTIAVVGTHGKTTTTAMLGLALIRSGLESTVIVGSKVKEFGGRNIYIGKGDLFVVEGCEYRRSFLSLEPFSVVFLNCEAEHLDYYKDEDDYKKAYIELIKKIPADGFMVANMEDENVQELAHHCAGKVIPAYKGEIKKLGLKLKVLGEFNQMNAGQAYLAAEAVGAQVSDVKQALEDFGGTWRRLEIKGEFNGAVLIDDYGHHPTEIELTLKAIKDKYLKKRLICIFQPHQYSRTHLLVKEFKGAFKDADKVIIPDIYEARDSDEDKSKIDAEKLVKLLSETHKDAEWGEGLDNTYKLLKEIVTEDDVVVTMGAGDIGELAERLAG
jgi:UDP-N-acetylmuramate--alanine ligase